MRDGQRQLDQPQPSGQRLVQLGVDVLADLGGKLQGEEIILSFGIMLGVLNKTRKTCFVRETIRWLADAASDEAVDAIEGAIDHVVTAATGGGEFSEDWDVDELMLEAADVFP